MSKLSIENIDRWGPGVVAILALLAVIAIGWTGSARASKLEGVILTQDREIKRIEDDLDIYQAYTISLQKRMIEHGIVVPDLPLPHKKEK